MRERIAACWCCAITLSIRTRKSQQFFEQYELFQKFRKKFKISIDKSNNVIYNNACH